jgi:protein-L-isoaspartate(D-aspartate) O-methyltransferase
MAAQIKKAAGQAKNAAGQGRNAVGIGMTSQRTRGRMVDRLREQGIRDERVLGAMGTVPRHLFVEEALASRAYEDTALPIGFAQTISQPYVVARMIELLIENEKSPGKVLEVGTGCGYQAAVLAQIFSEVYSIERIKGLHERARANLLGQRLTNLRLVHGDGHAGLDKAAPFRAIIVAAAARAVPEALERQIAPGGRMILPLRGSPGAQRQGAQQQDAQRLVLVERSGRGLIESELDPVHFVPLEAGKA